MRFFLNLALTLASMAVLSFAITPAGFMLDRDGGNVLVLKICSDTAIGGQSERPTVEIKLNNGQKDSGHSEQSQTCDYGMGGALALPNVPVSPIPERTRAAPLAQKRAVLSGIFPASLPPSTGPPIA